MNQIKLSDPASFSQTLLEFFLEQGWQSLSKRDLELLIFILMEKDGAIDRFASNYAIARQLRLTPSKVAALRKDAYARWRPLVAVPTQEMIKHILMNTLTQEKLESAARYASERRKEDGFLALLIEHPDYRAEMEDAIKNLGAIPVYERNPQVILIHHETLFKLAKEMKLLDDFPKVQSALRKLCGSKVTDLESFLKKDASALTWADVRVALNSTAAKIIAGDLTAVALPALLKAALPFLV